MCSGRLLLKHAAWIGLLTARRRLTLLKRREPMARNRPKSAKKSGPRKSFVGATQTKAPPDIPSSGTEFRPLSKRKIWIAASAAVVIVVAVGFGFHGHLQISKPGRDQVTRLCADAGAIRRRGRC